MCLKIIYLERGMEELEFKRWLETIQTTGLLKSAKIQGDLLSLWLEWKSTSNTGSKYLLGVLKDI